MELQKEHPMARSGSRRPMATATQAADPRVINEKHCRGNENSGTKSKTLDIATAYLSLVTAPTAFSRKVNDVSRFLLRFMINQRI